MADPAGDDACLNFLAKVLTLSNVRLEAAGLQTTVKISKRKKGIAFVLA